MTQEEKARAYDEALERAKKELKQDLHESGVWAIQRIFPELRESEDERIRKEIIQHFQDTLDTCTGITTTTLVKNWIAYLEKQKEPKQEWSEEDEKQIGRLRSVVNQLASYTDSLDVNGDYCEGDYAELDTWLKSLRPQPKQEWDTHDKAIVNCIVCCLDGQFVSEAARKQCLVWFNKHRRDFLNSPSWKPSEEQMKALGTIVKGYDECAVGSVGYNLKEMYEQLKKLT